MIHEIIQLKKFLENTVIEKNILCIFNLFVMLQFLPEIYVYVLHYLPDIAFANLLYLSFVSLYASCASVVPANMFISLSDVKYFFMTRKSYGHPGKCAYTFSTRQKINTLRPEIEFERVNRPAAYYSMLIQCIDF